MVGPGDDAAVLPPVGTPLVVSVDQCIEHLHFLPETPLADVGVKAVRRAAGDLAAMAASPVLLGTLRLKASDGLHHAAWFPALHVALACHSPVQTRDLARVGVCGVYRSTFEHDCLRT